jgi:hypothetical protein
MRTEEQSQKRSRPEDPVEGFDSPIGSFSWLIAIFQRHLGWEGAAREPRGSIEQTAFASEAREKKGRICPPGAGSVGEQVLAPAGNGTQPMPMERILCIYFMQQWFNLPDPAMGGCAVRLGVDAALYRSLSISTDFQIGAASWVHSKIRILTSSRELLNCS